jgi:hypothetical protein
MPLYRFVVDDGSSPPSADLFEFAGFQEAKSTAVNFATELLREKSVEPYAACDCRLEVAEERGPVLFTVEMHMLVGDPPWKAQGVARRHAGGAPRRA